MRENVSEMLEVYDAQLKLAHKWGAITVFTGLYVVVYANLVIFNFAHEWALSFLNPLLFSPIMGWCMVGIELSCFAFIPLTVYHKIKSVTIMREILRGKRAETDF